MRAWLLRIGLGLLALLLVLAGIAGWLVGTASGGRAALSLADRFLPGDLSVGYESFEGRLIGRFTLDGVTLRHPAVEADVGRVALDWRGLGLLRRQVHIRSLVVDGADVRLTGAAGSDSLAAEPEREPGAGPPLSNLPVTLSFDSIAVRDAHVTTADSLRVTVSEAVLTGPGEATGSGDVTATGGTTAPGSIEAYRLRASARVEGPDLPPADVQVSGSGSNRAFALDTLEVLVLEGRVAASGDATWWPEPGWELDLAADSLAPAPLLPEPQAWPGRISLRGSSSGARDASGTLALRAAIDTVYGSLRGESLSGRIEATVTGSRIELVAARVAWGPARVEASGEAGEVLDLAFEAEVPDLGLAVPGVAGSLRAEGRAEGPRTMPRLRATIRARDVATEAATAESVSGDVDLDLAGPLRADLFATGVGVAGRELDSVRVTLDGRRAAHALRIAASGPRADLALEAEGGLDEANRWSGTLDRLAFRADTIGAWELERPATLVVGGELEIGQLCLHSAPARLCAEGERNAAGLRLLATIDSLRVERFAAFLPEDYGVEAGLDARIDVRRAREGALTGTVDVRTTEGRVSLPPTEGDEARVLRFQPITIAVASADSGAVGEVDFVLTDPAGAALLRIDGAFDSPIAFRQTSDFERLGTQPWSARLDLAADDLELLSAYALPRWDARGSLQARVELDVTETGTLTGTIHAAADSMSLQNTVRENAYLLSLNPFRFDARVGPEGLEGELELVVTVPDARPARGPLFEARGEVRMPQFRRLEFEPAEQSVDATFSVRADDLYFLEAFFPEVSEVGGRFALESRVAGTLAGLEVEGTADLSEGYAVIPLLGLSLRDVRLEAVSAVDGEIRLDGEVTSGEGTLTLTGAAEEYPSADQPSHFQVRGERFRVLDTPELRVDASPALDLSFDGSMARLTGDVTIPTARIGIPDLPESAVTPSKDVVIVGDTLEERSAPIPYSVDLTLTLGDDVTFDGFGLDAQLTGGLNITQPPGGEPRGRGEIQLVNGTFRQLGQELRIDPGRMVFNGPIDDPAIDARAFVRATDGTEAGFRVGGTVQNLALDTYSNPPKTESDIMSYILFGRPMSQTSGTEGSQASNAAALLGANMLAMSLAPSVGLDEARVETGTQQNKAQLVVGKYLSPKLYVGYGIGLYEPISTLRLRYLLNSRWSIEAITGDQQSTDLLYRIERGGPKEEELAAEAGPEGE